ncbi:Hypothetical protein ING2D1G_0386 [Peptoniphilus sp. ING2-D1G]|nr:Hypothetical protein ING2D1G_0386 [Peptoniphilus sp. ING2-D1G]
MDLKKLDNIKVPEEEIRYIKDKIYGKRKSYRFKYAVASLALVFAIGFAFPGYTKDLPIYRNIYSLIGMDNFGEAGDLVNAVDNDKGIEIRIVEAVYSNNTVSFSYEIKSDEFLGEDITLMEDFQYKNNRSDGSSGASYFEYVGDNTYIGYGERREDFIKKDVTPLKTKVKISRINSHSTGKEVKGNWEFDVVLNQKNAQRYRFDKEYEKSGYVARLNNVSVDDLGTEFDVTITNNLGFDVFAYHDYPIQLKTESGEIVDIKHEGGTGRENIMKSYYRYDEKLKKGEEYTLIISLSKNNDVTYFETNADGTGDVKEVTADYAYDENFINAPQNIVIEIPVKIE